MDDEKKLMHGLQRRRGADKELKGRKKSSLGLLEENGRASRLGSVGSLIEKQPAKDPASAVVVCVAVCRG